MTADLEPQAPVPQTQGPRGADVPSSADTEPAFLKTEVQDEHHGSTLRALEFEDLLGTLSVPRMPSFSTE